MTDLINEISAHVDLRPRGFKYTGLCPFHVEQSPSFCVDPVQKTWMCFGCGAGGGIEEFREQFEKQAQATAQVQGNLSRRECTDASPGIAAEVRMPDVEAIHKRMCDALPLKCWLFVSPEGRAFVVQEGSEAQIARAHSDLAWLVAIYGGRNGLPSLSDIEGDIAHHLRAASPA